MNPINERVIIEPDGGAKVNEYGIFIPSNPHNPVNKGVVRAVAKGVREISVGDVVLFTPNLGIDVEIDGRKLQVYNQNDVICVL